MDIRRVLYYDGNKKKEADAKFWDADALVLELVFVGECDQGIAHRFSYLSAAQGVRWIQMVWGRMREDQALAPPVSYHLFFCLAGFIRGNWRIRCRESSGDMRKELRDENW